MDLFFGSKLVQAKPMTRAEYNDYRGWTLPADENGADEGMLVEYIDGGASNHPSHSGYISWSPKEVFEKSYRRTNGLSFGEALDALKIGLRVARSGWNGKGMWLILVRPVGENDAPELPAGYQASGDELVMLERMPWIGMRTAEMGFVPWLASQTDMLGEDWVVVS